MRHEAIYNTHPNVKSIDDGLGAFDKNGNSVTIDEAKVAEEIKRLEAEYEANQYQHERAEQYPSIKDVVVALAEKQEGDDSMWQEITALRQKVKSEIPKPT